MKRVKSVAGWVILDPDTPHELDIGKPPYMCFIFNEGQDVETVELVGDQLSVRTTADISPLVPIVAMEAFIKHARSWRARDRD